MTRALSSLRHGLRAVLLIAALAAPFAQAAAPEPSVPQAGGEPQAQHIVSEDKQVRIEELRVRGETQRVVVQPKAASAPAYEIVVHDAGSKASSGQRVWNVFGF